jgi:hypothetical protein
MPHAFVFSVRVSVGICVATTVYCGIAVWREWQRHGQFWIAWSVLLSVLVLSAWIMLCERLFSTPRDRPAPRAIVESLFGAIGMTVIFGRHFLLSEGSALHIDSIGAVGAAIMVCAAWVTLAIRIRSRHLPEATEQGEQDVA